LEVFTVDPQSTVYTRAAGPLQAFVIENSPPETLQNPKPIADRNA